jgi:hypothetical protein
MIESFTVTTCEEVSLRDKLWGIQLHTADCPTRLHCKRSIMWRPVFGTQCCAVRSEPTDVSEEPVLSVFMLAPFLVYFPTRKTDRQTTPGTQNFTWSTTLLIKRKYVDRCVVWSHVVLIIWIYIIFKIYDNIIFPSVLNTCRNLVSETDGKAQIEGVILSLLVSEQSARA